MRMPLLSCALVLLVSGCSKQQERAPSTGITLPPRLESYLEQYCDYTGNLGIGFVAWHTYDYRFRQHLKMTHDPELKRLYVLQNLHLEAEHELDDFKAGRIRIGQAEHRPLTLPEWQSAQQRIQAMIDDLATYAAFTNFTTSSQDLIDRPDPSAETSWVEELRQALRSVTNALAANPQGGANGRQPSSSETNRTSAAAASRRSP